VKGVPIETLAKNSEAAIAACGEATTAHPEVAHYVALLARATAAAGRFGDAYKLYEKAADMNDTRAMVSLGLMLETGDHAPRNLKAAYEFYEKAAERGSADGAMDLAVALIEGRGIEKNVPRAYALLRKASESGSPRATYDLAYVTSEGRGGNPADAARLFRKAGDDGYPEGYRAAAVLLDEGRGVPKDPKAAAEDLLHGVSDDAGESFSDLSGRTQRWSLETIKVVQSRLKTAGYYSGPINGRSGPEIEPALKQWRLLGDRAH
jgi:TPR repeat protein